MRRLTTEPRTLLAPSHTQALDTAGLVAELARRFRRRERLAAGLACGVEYGDGGALSAVVHHQDELVPGWPDQGPFGIGGSLQRVAKVPAPHREVVVHRLGRIREAGTLTLFVVVLHLLHQRPDIHHRFHRVGVQLPRDPFQVQRVSSGAGVGGKSERSAELVGNLGGPAHRRVEECEVLEPIGERVTQGDETVRGRTGRRPRRHGDPHRGVVHRRTNVRSPLNAQMRDHALQCPSCPRARPASVSPTLGSAAVRQRHAAVGHLQAGYDA